MTTALSHSHFSRLPAELIESILEYAITSEDELFAIKYSHWLSIIHTCRYFYRIARPIRIRSLSFKTLASLERFQCALPQDPSIRESCLQFSLTTPHYNDHTDPVAVHALCPPAKAILPQLSKVRRLAIHGDFDEEDAWPFYLRLFDILSDLQDLTLKWTQWCEGIFWDLFCATFNVSHLERLTIDGNVRTPEFTLAKDRKGFCGVTHLTLRNFSASTRILKVFLTFLTALESLELAFGTSRPFPDGARYMVMQEALYSQQLTLQTLKLSTHRTIYIDQLSSFRDFTALRSMAFRYIQLPESWSAKETAARMLGPALVTIHIDFRQHEDHNFRLYDFTVRDGQWIYDFAETASSTGSALKEIIITVETHLLRYHSRVGSADRTPVCPVWDILERVRKAIEVFGISLVCPQPLAMPTHVDADVEMTG